MTAIRIPKKLIEVALPLDDINEAAAREKSIRHGHPSTLHLWWARRPLAAARAVIFAQMVNDPGFEKGNGFQRGLNKKEAEKKREELFQIIRDLVKWENTNNEEVLNRAREAIWESWRETCQLNRAHPQANELFDPEKLPAFHDPFAGGGAIPLEAQRLGLESYASDLNPVAVIINKAMIEIPPKFAGRAPVGPIPTVERQSEMPREWHGAQGLAEDVRRYGHWMREEAFKRIGHLYPKVKITEELVKTQPDLIKHIGKDLDVIAWIWARVIKCPNPACQAEVPLLKSYQLSEKKEKPIYLSPKIDQKSGKHLSFDITTSKPANDKNVERRYARCECCETHIKLSDIENSARDMGFLEQLVAIVASSGSGRIYLPATQEHEEIAKAENTEDFPKCKIDHWRSCTNCVVYGFDAFELLFTKRQMLALTLFADLISDLSTKVQHDCVSIGKDDLYAKEYGHALSTYLTLALGKAADYNSNMCSWISGGETMRNTYGRQALPMVWDFAEANILGDSTGCFLSGVQQISRVLEKITPYTKGEVSQLDAASQEVSLTKVISTDPPYYDNIPYSNLSDFFYMWHRRALHKVYPNVYSTISVPRMPELVANQFRHNGKERAEKFFMDGMTKAMSRLVDLSHPAFPVTIYYAFKQSETKNSQTTNTGWDAFLEAVLEAGFAIDGTWPMRTEMANRMIGAGNNALASSIVLVCQKRPEAATSISRRDFQRELRERMPEALETMIGGETGQTPIAPVDLAQAAIGPGMAIFSKYAAVLNQDGSKMSVHDALIMINKEITEFLNPDSGSFDGDTMFCSAWFDQYGWSAGVFGEADTLARAKGTSVDGVKESGVIESGNGKVRLLKWAEYPSEWDPTQDERTPIWEACHHMIRKLNYQGESEAGALLARMPDKGEAIRQLAYHLYTLCERKKWAEDARAYNELIGAWHAIVSASHEVGHKGSQQELQLNFG